MSFQKEGEHNKPLVYDFPIHFDCKNIVMGYAKGGSFSTQLPISSKEFRGKFRDDVAQVVVDKGKEITSFYITDDYGCEYIVKLSNDNKDTIERAIAAAREDDLLEEV